MDTHRRLERKTSPLGGREAFTVPLAPSCVDTKPTPYRYQYGSDTARQEWTPSKLRAVELAGGGEGSYTPPTGPVEPGKLTMRADIIFLVTASTMQTSLTTPCNPQKYKWP